MGIRIAVFASGSGTNFQAIVDAVKSGYIPGKVVFLLSDRADAFAIKRALKEKIPAFVVDWRHRDWAERVAVAICKAYKTDLVALAGFMKILGKYFVDNFRFKAMNIHPSILPAFQGTTRAQKRAVEWGVKISGCTVHFVDETVDGGPVIIQGATPVFPDDTEEDVRQRILKLEHKIYPFAIKLFAEGRIKVDGRKVFIDGVEKREFFITNPSVE